MFSASALQPVRRSSLHMTRYASSSFPKTPSAAFQVEVQQPVVTIARKRTIQILNQFPLSAAMSSGTAPTSTVDIDANIPDVAEQLPPLDERLRRREDGTLPYAHANFVESYPPEPPKNMLDPTIHEHPISVFLAGSIEMGNAIAWQQHMIALLQHLPIIVCNPRRGAWDPTTLPKPQDKDFNTQVEWELNALTAATVICFFFDETTMSPVTMMELGIWAAKDPRKVVVCCGDQFWKGGNVDMVCDRYGITHVKDYTELVVEVKRLLSNKGLKSITEDEIEKDQAIATDTVLRKTTNALKKLEVEMAITGKIAEAMSRHARLSAKKAEVAASAFKARKDAAGVALQQNSQI